MEEVKRKSADTLLYVWFNSLYSPSHVHYLFNLGISMVLALTLFIRVLVSPSLALLTIAGIYGNFWVPQIIRSARRGTASGLRLEYLLGTTACRAFFALCELEFSIE